MTANGTVYFRASDLEEFVGAPVLRTVNRELGSVCNRCAGETRRWMVVEMYALAYKLYKLKTGMKLLKFIALGRVREVREERDRTVPWLHEEEEEGGGVKFLHWLRQFKSEARRFKRLGIRV